MTGISGAELAAFRTVVLAPGQPDPVAGVLTATIDLVRGYIGGCQRNVLGPEGTIPDKLVKPAVDMAVMTVMSRAGGRVQDPDGVRKEANRTAIQLMRDVASCAFMIERPEVLSTEIPQMFTPSISGRRRTSGRYREEGI